MNSELYIQKFMEDHRFQLDKKTIELYKSVVKQFLVYSKKPLEEITRRDIKGWMNHLYKKGYKVCTIYSKIIGVKKFFQYCMEEAFINKDPAKDIALPHIEENIPHYLTLEQLNQLRSHVAGRKEERAIIEVLYSTGMRISEMAAIKKGDIHWEERMISIPNGKGKKERIVLFTRECAEHLRAYLEERQDDLPYVFINKRKNQHICVRTVQYKFDDYSEVLQFKLSPHTLRHTFAAHLARKGMKLECIQELLGHEGPQQARLYAKLYDHARKEMYDEWM